MIPRPATIAVGAVAMVWLMAPACSGGDDPPEPEDTQAFCSQLRSATAEASAVGQIDLTDPASIDAAIATLQQVSASAPQSVSGDVGVIVDAYTQLVEALELPDNRTPAEVIAEQSDGLADAGAAAARVDAYSRRECGIDLSPPPTPTPTPADADDLAPA